MGRLLAIIQKETLLLVRDRAGLAILYAMPLCLVVIMAIVQDAPFRSFQEHRVSVVFRDLDSGQAGEQLLQGLKAAKAFDVLDVSQDPSITDAQLRELVRRGDHQVGIIVPNGVSKAIDARSFALVDGMFQAITAPGDTTPSSAQKLNTAQILLIIDPTVKLSFRQTLHSVLGQLITAISSDRLVGALGQRVEEMAGAPSPKIKMDGLGVTVHEELATDDAFGTRVATNSTQHNVPAWTIFAMFFMVVPLSGNMVRERTSGAALRLRTMPGSAWEHLGGKLAVYLCICLTQFVMLMLVGRYVLPHFGLHPLMLASGYLLLVLAALSTGLAATAYGILIGSMFTTHQQSAITGAVSVVILSALGGVWVPLYVMPEAMQAIGSLSPLAWSLDAFNVVLLRQGSWAEMWPHILPLWAFAAGCIGLSVAMERRLVG